MLILFLMHKFFAAAFLPLMYDGMVSCCQRRQ